MRHGGTAIDSSDPRHALIARVEDLWRRGLITGEILGRARLSDCIVVVDFIGDRFDVSLLPRASVADAVAADCQDKVLVAMTKGQPDRCRGEDVAAWCFVAEWENGEPIREVHFSWSAWRDPKGSA